VEGKFFYDILNLTDILPLQLSVQVLVSQGGTMKNRKYILLLFVLFLISFPCSATANPLDNWSTVTTNTDDWYYGLSSGNNTFVTVGAYGKILTSPDGLSWTSRITGDTHHLYGVGFGNGTFVAVGYLGTIFTSWDNGVTWTLTNSGQAHPVSENLYGVAYGSGKFVVAGGLGRILASLDNGATWFDPFWPYSSPTANWLYEATYDNSLFVDVGAAGTILTSTDGATWDVETSGTPVDLKGVAYGNDTFVVVGDGGIVLTSPDGILWTITRDPSSSQEDLNGITYGLVDGSGYFIAVGESGAILTSSDGITWTYRNSGTTYSLEDIVYSNPLFVAVGGYGTILRTFSGSIVINGAAGYTTSVSATLTLSCGEFSSSECSQMQFSNDGATWSPPETYNTSKAWPLTSGDGLKTVYVKFQDISGNWSDPYSDSIILDTTAPSTNASPGGGMYYSSQSVTLTCSDGSGSGCQGIYYTTDGSTPTTSSTVYSSPISIASNETLKFFARDNVGNTSSVSAETYLFASPLAITTTSLASGTVGSPYSQTLTAAGGFPPYSWSIVSGSLPGGFSLDSITGELSGTPTISGTFNFTIELMDASSAVSQPLSITIEASPAARNENTPFEILNTIQDVYNAAGDGNTIQAVATTFAENLNFDRNISVTLMGGFNSDFSSNDSFTTINGSLTISNGIITLDKIMIK
jgi:photosystem II stability/assembly factor-like uncharacterized protein